jgi:hypothetical protein
MKHIILIILLTLGVWGQEVGMPYVDAREAVAQSATLSPDGETFYTYANNTLTHWSLSPVKVLESVRIEDMDIVNGSKHRIYVTPDQKKIIFVTRKILALFDLNQNIFVKKITMLEPATNLIGSDLIAVGHHKSKTLIYQINPNTLEVLMMGNLIAPTEDADFPYHVLGSKTKETLTIVTYRQFLVVDRNTLQMLKRFSAVNDDDSYISYDGHYFKSNVVFDLDKQELSNDTDKVMLPYPYPWSSISHSSYLSLTGNGSFYKYKDGSYIGRLYQFHDNNWIVINWDDKFSSSPEARKYLHIKTPSGKLVPINDATYEKFHKQISIENK